VDPGSHVVAGLDVDVARSTLDRRLEKFLHQILRSLELLRSVGAILRK
jgi:hypothetical protein